MTGNHRIAALIRLWRALFLCFAASAAFCPWRHARADEPEEKGMTFWNEDGSDKVSWVKMADYFNKNLAKAQQVNFYLDLCYAGELPSMITAGDVTLNMPYVMSAAAPADEVSEGNLREKDSNPAARLKAYDGSFYAGYLAYMAKRLKDGPVPKAKELHDNVTTKWTADPDFVDGRTPVYLKGGSPDEDLKLDGGTTSRHTLLFAGTTDDDVFEAPFFEAAIALKKMTLTTFDVYYDGTDGKQDFKGVTVKDAGTLANFKTALGVLKTATEANPQKELVNLFLHGHGYSAPKDSEKQVNALPDTPKQGRLINASAGDLAIVTSSNFWSGLKEGVVQDDPLLRRAGPPTFFLAVSEAYASQPFSVSIGGVPLGSYTLPLSSTGAILTVTLSNSFLVSLIGSNDGASQLTIHVGMIAGDYLRLALDADMLFDPDFTPAQTGCGIALELADSVNPPRSGTYLDLQQTNGAVTLSWLNEYPGFVLQSSPTLINPAWTNVPPGGTNSVTLPFQPGTHFFRLITP